MLFKQEVSGVHYRAVNVKGSFWCTWKSAEDSDAERRVRAENDERSLDRIEKYVYDAYTD
ncbi:hypothetical protein E2C01_001212 [Portunus trituberculatus]|uniref:Uncharacterized protein n=1 Tax=Portunus trituberculatus TaxID=210409 RepID=A0A5B7CM22_PORTR|nr:hypothetical protein [Portunus trituberculatus]